MTRIYYMAGVGNSQNPQVALDELLKVDEGVYYRLLALSEIIQRYYDATQPPFSPDPKAVQLEAQYQDLVARYTARQAALVNDGFISNAVTGALAAWSWLVNKFSGGSVQGIGAIPLIPLAIIAGVALFTTTATSVYIAYKVEAQNDQKQLDQVLRSFERLPGANASGLKGLLAGVGFSFSSFWGKIGKLALWGGAAFLGYKFYLQKQKKSTAQ